MISTAKPGDGDGILRITATAGVFSKEEVDCVAELWDEYLMGVRKKPVITSLSCKKKGTCWGMPATGRVPSPMAPMTCTGSQPTAMSSAAVWVRSYGTI